MKRYLLFNCEAYYPFGGWRDFAGSFDTIEEARLNYARDMSHVVDAHSGKIVAAVHDGKDQMDFYRQQDPETVA